MPALFNAETLRLMKYWMLEREKVRQKKEANLSKPWTSDRIIAMHRWCSVRRMDDKVSQWLLHNWYDTKVSPRMLVTAAALARLLNWPDTLLQLVGPDMYFHKWNASAVKNKLNKWQRAGNKVFTGAYIINGAAGGSKIDQVVRHVHAISTAMRNPDGRPVIDTRSMEATHHALMQFNGIGSFMAGQIVADLRHVVPGEWRDRMVWAPLGPGSARGMRRLLGKEARGAMRQSEFNDLLPHLMGQLQRDRRIAVIFADRKLEAMDIQNVCCEVDKYIRLLNNEGHVRSGYPGGY